MAARIAARLRDATIGAISRGDHERSVLLAGLAARRSPYDESSQILLATAFVAAGAHGDALQHVRSVEALFRDELGCDPTPALRRATRLAPRQRLTERYR